MGYVQLYEQNDLEPVMVEGDFNCSKHCKSMQPLSTVQAEIKKRAALQIDIYPG